MAIVNGVLSILPIEFWALAIMSIIPLAILVELLTRHHNLLFWSILQVLSLVVPIWLALRLFGIV
jgi:hypothetical protein